MEQPQQPASKKQTIHWLWWIIAAILLIWNIFSYLPKSRPEINIPYSKFINQVNEPTFRTSRIGEITITGMNAKQANNLLVNRA